MRILKRMLKQDAVYWGVTGFNPSGEPEFAAPIDIKCRWEEVSEVFLSVTGADEVSNAIVYVDRDVVVQGQLRQGKVANLPVPNGHPSDNPGSYAIRKFEKLPTLDAKFFLRTCYL